MIPCKKPSYQIGKQLSVNKGCMGNNEKLYFNYSQTKTAFLHDTGILIFSNIPVHLLFNGKCAYGTRTSPQYYNVSSKNHLDLGVA
jgi:hypothetical protein